MQVEHGILQRLGVGGNDVAERGEPAHKAALIGAGAVRVEAAFGGGGTGGVAGIMGNARGGRIGAMVSGFIYGFELILFSGFTYSLFGHFASVGAEGTGHDCIDAMALMTVMKNPIIGIILIVAAFVLMSFLEVRYQKKVRSGAAK